MQPDLIQPLPVLRISYLVSRTAWDMKFQLCFRKKRNNYIDYKNVLLGGSYMDRCKISLREKPLSSCSPSLHVCHHRGPPLYKMVTFQE